jgi:lipid-binding SYLF domain-containing protein
MKRIKLTIILSIAAVAILFHSGCAINTGEAAPTTTIAPELDAAANTSLKSLYASNPNAKALGRKARAILVFPDIVKGGFMVGAETGNGVLRQNGRTIGYYNISAASYGFQAGLQTFGYALFLMNDSAMAYLHNTGGWQIGVGPSVVIVDQGMAHTLTSTTLTQDVYAFVFNQQGLMAGAGLQGSKITQIGQ